MGSEKYRNYFKGSLMMGPDCLRLLDEILGEYPLHYTSKIDLIVIPGIKSEYDGKSEELLTVWAGDEAYMFQSTEFRKRIIGEYEDIEEVEFGKCRYLIWPGRNGLM